MVSSLERLSNSLKVEKSPELRQRLVVEALQEGCSIEEVRELLDSLELERQAKSVVPPRKWRFPLFARPAKGAG